MTKTLTFTTPGPRLLSGSTNLRWGVLLIVALTLLGLSGCRTAPVQDVDNRPVPAGLSMSDVSKAIQSAGNSLGWVMKETGPGMIVGTLFVRDHMAKVEISYSKSGYSIRYADSSNLKYDASKQTIHSNYAGWIQNLDNQIRRRLSVL
ncbi:hypothetical protein [Thiocystis violascens]|uniref:Lipoprotein n=1 Tax=Thiocystis violascens (strain ATCC 17096 / DSM 198 / 6111) TaxID=765911 RepID=I3YB39_THIV6|nr:hypothetical protein [Thiocystis violascens]AFL74207.1 hypothetical protein Thivi_2258 [Thiocystis violascens DSM 198]